MADNKVVDSAATVAVATDEVTYSGDASQHVQLTHPVMVTGAEGSKTPVEIYRAEDTAHTSGDFGIQALAIRQDTATTGLGADGDYAPLRLDANGRLQVAVGSAPSTAVTNAGTFAVQADSVIPGSGATNLGKAEDAVHNSGDIGVLALAVRRDAASPAAADGDYAALSVTSDGSLRVSGSSGTTQYAEDAVAASGDQLCIMGAVRRDEGISSSITDGDYVTLNTDSAGALRVTIDSATTSSILTDDAAFTPATSKVAMVGATFDDSSPDTVNEGDGGALRMSANRNLYVNIRDNAGNERGLNVDASGNITANINGTVTVGAHAVTNAGTFATQVDGAALTALQKIDDPVLVDDAAFTPATSSVMMAGFEADESSPDSVDEGDAGAARMTLDRKVIVTPQPHTAGGLSIFRSIDLDEGTLEVVKASPGQVYAVWVTNTATATRWVKFYNATSGTYGTGTPVITIGIPGNASDDVSGNFGPGGMGIAFDTGISVGAGTGVADADTGAPGANDVIINVFYK